MASSGSQLTQYNHFENQILKINLLLYSKRAEDSIGKREASSLRGFHENLRTLSGNSRTRECWKSHVQKKVKGSDEHKKLVREKGLLGLPLFSQEVFSLGKLRASREGPRSLEKGVAAEGPEEPEHWDTPFYGEFYPSTCRVDSCQLLLGSQTPHSVLDQESEVCQSHMPSDSLYGRTSDACDLAAEKSTAASASPADFSNNKLKRQINEHEMNGMFSKQQQQSQIDQIFNGAEPQNQFDLESSLFGSYRTDQFQEEYQDQYQDHGQSCSFHLDMP